MSNNDEWLFAARKQAIDAFDSLVADAERQADELLLQMFNPPTVFTDDREVTLLNWNKADAEAVQAVQMALATVRARIRRLRLQQR